MEDSFKGTNYITLQPGDTSVPVKFKFKPATASTLNDGVIPYGSTVKGTTWIKVREINATTSSASTALIVTKSQSSNVVTIFLRHSSTLTGGLYQLTFKANVSISGSTRIMRRQFDFNRIYLKSR